MTAEKTWTVNAIKDAMRAAGSHWFDPDTMRSFGTKVLPTVYQGPGGVFFVTEDDQFRRELPKRFTVRCFHPATSDIQTMGELGGYRTKDAARDAARSLAGGENEEATETDEAFKPVSVLEQFLADLEKHGKTSDHTRGDADALMDRARRHHRLMEKLCNGELATDAEGDSPEVGRCRKAIRNLAADVGATGVIFSGDPRGCTVKLTFADGYTNDFGSEGYCVPTGEDD